MKEEFERRKGVRDTTMSGNGEKVGSGVYNLEVR